MGVKIWFVVILLSIGSRFAAAEQASEFRGYSAINQALLERLLKPGADFELGRYVGEEYSFEWANLLDLLGTYKSISSGDRLRNGAPNSLNMLLWHLLFSGLARDVAKICDGEEPLAFRSDFVAHVLPLCLWPGPAARSDEVLYVFWQALLDFDAPYQEFEEWKAFVQSDEMDAFAGREAVEWLTLSVLTNPYLLLRR